MKITCGDKNIEPKSDVKYLGVTFDSPNCNDKICEKIVKMIDSRLAFLYRKNHLFTFEIRKLLANALLLPVFDFGSISFYTNLTGTNKKRLQRQQNKCIRFILNLPKQSHINYNEFCYVQWLPLLYRVNFLKLSTFYCLKNSPSQCCPKILIKNLVSASKTHSHKTRSSVSNNFYVPHSS